MAILTAPKHTHMFDDTSEDAPTGTFAATCIGIRDVFDVERRKFQSDETERVNLTAFLFGFRDRNGQPYKVASRTFRISGNDKSSLFAFLKSWLGKAPQMNWDYAELKGHKALITIERIPSTRNPGQFIPAIASISPLPEGYQALAQPHPAPAPVAFAEASTACDELPF